MTAAVDPLDERYEAPRPPLASIPWNKVELTEQGRAAIAAALLAGYPRNQVARAMGTSVKTLKRLIDDDPELTDALDARKDAEEAELRDILMDLARRGDTVAAIFLGKSHYGWRDRDDGKIRIEGSAGGALVVPAPIAFDDWSSMAAGQQAKFREAPPEPRKPDDGQRGSPGIEGLRLVKPGR